MFLDKLDQIVEASIARVRNRLQEGEGGGEGGGGVGREGGGGTQGQYGGGSGEKFAAGRGGCEKPRSERRSRIRSGKREKRTRGLGVELITGRRGRKREKRTRGLGVELITNPNVLLQK